jgi:hypothetical protein
MKAEHRKELQTNLLADSMGKLVQKVKSPASTRSVVLWVIAALVVAVVGVWLYSVNHATDSSGNLWVKIDGEMYTNGDRIDESRQADVVKDFQEIAKEQKHGMAGRVARFQEARFLLPIGLKNLASPMRDEAASNIKRARELYEGLAKECTDTPVLQQEAYLGAARAEEALTGTPEKDGADKKLGSAEKALTYYKKARDVKPDSYFGKEAAKHVAELEKNSEKVVAFYTELYKRSGFKSRPPVPGQLPLPSPTP